MLQQDEGYKATELRPASESSPHTADDQHETSQRGAIPNPQLSVFLALLLNVKQREAVRTASSRKHKKIEDNCVFAPPHYDKRASKKLHVLI